MRTADEQHEMLQHALDASRFAASEDGSHDEMLAAARNQEVQALTSIALELRELREYIRDEGLTIFASNSAKDALRVWAGMETHGKGGTVSWVGINDVMTVDCTLTGDTRWPKGARVEQLRAGQVIGSEKVIDDRGTLAAPFAMKAGDEIRVER